MQTFYLSCFFPKPPSVHTVLLTPYLMRCLPKRLTAAELFIPYCIRISKEEPKYFAGSYRLYHCLSCGRYRSISFSKREKTFRFFCFVFAFLHPSQTKNTVNKQAYHRFVLKKYPNALLIYLYIYDIIGTKFCGVIYG